MERLHAMANELAAQQEKLARQLEENHVLLLDIAEGVTNYIQAQQAAAGESRPIRRAVEGNQAAWTAYVVELCVDAGLSSNTAKTVQSAHERRAGHATGQSPRAITPPRATTASSTAYANYRPAGMSDSEDEDDFETWLSPSCGSQRHTLLPDDDELIEAWCRKHNWPTN